MFVRKKETTTMTPDFIHRFVPASGGNVATSPTLLLLHGTGGNEDDLLQLGHSLAPGANLLSPRGKILENGMPRFFRRLAEGVFDEVDLLRRTQELGDFVIAAAKEYGFSPETITAVGYSNGANIAASLLLLRPGILKNAVLLRAMVPLTPTKAPDLTGTRVFLASGLSDPILPIDNARTLGKMLRDAGSELTHLEINTGHQLTSGELDTARTWLGDGS
ncbi:alpha/beta hydrolase [Luteolibacter yonseiensis]